MPTPRKSRLGVHELPPSKKGAAGQLVQAASIKCIVFVTPLGVPHDTETDEMRPGLYPAVPQPNSAIDFREEYGDVVAVTGVNFVAGSNVVTILGTIMSFTPEEALELDVAASHEFGVGPTAPVGNADGDEVRIDRRGLDHLLDNATNPLAAVGGTVEVFPHDQAPEPVELLPPAE